MIKSELEKEVEKLWAMPEKIKIYSFEQIKYLPQPVHHNQLHTFAIQLEGI